MSWVFVLFILLAAAALILTFLWGRGRRSAKRRAQENAKRQSEREAVASRRGLNPDYRLPGDEPVGGSLRLHGAFPLSAAVLALVMLLLSMFIMVGTRDIGIVTSFGRPVDHLDNGLHFKWPWEEVSTLDGAIQTDSYVSDGKDVNANGSCTDIRIGNESTACVDNSIRWRIKPDAADTLFQDYHTMDNIRDSLVTRELKAALNSVLANYNPLDEIENNSSGATPQLSAFSKQVTSNLQSQIGSQVDVINVIIPLIRFDSSTQTKINLYQAEVANTRIAQQREQTAAAQARANDALTKSVSNNPNVLVAQCLNSLDEMVKQKQAVPAGFSCWPGGSSSLVLPVGK